MRRFLLPFHVDIPEYYGLLFFLVHPLRNGYRNHQPIIQSISSSCSGIEGEWNLRLFAQTLSKRSIEFFLIATCTASKHGAFSIKLSDHSFLSSIEV